ncbi:MAG: ATP-binding cassette domain-containing protein [Gammaproteobacteria bacterium]|nr:ATP-binding cassette domain-containing protein [Gammaproteobacteria bacterium]NKB65289.1 ATP-binding cassette domain-containing protein [Gammaproteobacteria bacterium]
MLKLDHVAYDYPEVSISVDFELAAGGALALMGPSGCGKTTTLDLIAGFLSPHRGDIRFGSQSLLTLRPDARPLSYLFQQHNLFPHLSVWQNIALGIHPGLKLSSDEKKQIDHSLETVGLSGFGDRRPDQLSGGQQQRVGLARGLARSLLCDKSILLLDEPFSALDQARRSQIIELINQLRAKHQLTLIISTHQMGDAQALNAEVYLF